MFKFLFGRKNNKVEAVIETQRQTVERALSEVNDVLSTLESMPLITIDAANSTILVNLPEHMPDEALALPAPSEEATAQDTPETAVEETAEAEAEPAADLALETEAADADQSEEKPAEKTAA